MNAHILHKKELVIAAYDKSLDWLNSVKEDVKVTVYRKGTENFNSNEIFLKKNVGRCVHTFFNHIYTNYESLAEQTFFAQDYPFDHWSNLLDCLQYDTETLKQNCALHHEDYYGFDTLHIKNTDSYSSNLVGKGRVLVSRHDGLPSHPNLPLAAFWKEFFVSDTPPYFEFNPGGHFVISNTHLHKRTKKLYGKIVDVLENGCPNVTQDINIIPYCIERLENYIFNDKYITLF